VITRVPNLPVSPQPIQVLVLQGDPLHSPRTDQANNQPSSLQLSQQYNLQPGLLFGPHCVPPAVLQVNRLLNLLFSRQCIPLAFHRVSRLPNLLYSRQCIPPAVRQVNRLLNQRHDLPADRAHSQVRCRLVSHRNSLPSGQLLSRRPSQLVSLALVPLLNLPHVLRLGHLDSQRSSQQPSLSQYLRLCLLLSHQFDRLFSPAHDRRLTRRYVLLLGQLTNQPAAHPGIPLSNRPLSQARSQHPSLRRYPFLIHLFGRQISQRELPHVDQVVNRPSSPHRSQAFSRPGCQRYNLPSFLLRDRHVNHLGNLVPSRLLSRRRILQVAQRDSLLPSPLVGQVGNHLSGPLCSPYPFPR
jgi:hypothetical protein